MMNAHCIDAPTVGTKWIWILACVAIVWPLSIGLCSAAGSAVDNKDEKVLLSKIRTVHWVTTTTRHKANGMTVVGTEEGWLKSPTVWKTVSQAGTVDTHYSRDRYIYYGQRNVFQHAVSKYAPSFPLRELIPGNMLLTKNLTAKSVKHTMVEYEGKTCPAVQVDVDSHTTVIGRKVGPEKLIDIVDPTTGLLHARTETYYNFDGTTVDDEFVTVYDYNNVNLPDSFFIFTPPADATEEPLQ